MQGDLETSSTALVTTCQMKQKAACEMKSKRESLERSSRLGQ